MVRDKAIANDAGSSDTDVTATDMEVALTPQAVEAKDTTVDAECEHEAVSVLRKLASEVAQ
jgi:hypothetical protein